jgi:RNA binding exosome subunit
MVEQPFNVEVSRTQMEGKSRYGQAITWTNYRLNRTKYNAEGIAKMEEYVKEQLATINVKTDNELRSHKQTALFQ